MTAEEELELHRSIHSYAVSLCDGVAAKYVHMQNHSAATGAFECGKALRDASLHIRSVEDVWRNRMWRANETTDNLTSLIDQFEAQLTFARNRLAEQIRDQ